MFQLWRSETVIVYCIHLTTLVHTSALPYTLILSNKRNVTHDFESNWTELQTDLKHIEIAVFLFQFLEKTVGAPLNARSPPPLQLKEHQAPSVPSPRAPSVPGQAYGPRLDSLYELFLNRTT